MICFLKFEISFSLCDITWITSVVSTALYLLFNLFPSQKHHWIVTKKLRNGKPIIRDHFTVTAKTANHLKPFNTNRNHPKPSRNQPQSSKTTQKYFQSPHILPNLTIASPTPPKTSPQRRNQPPITTFLAIDFQQEFMIREIYVLVRLRNL